MGRKVLIDTNICIGYIGGKFQSHILDELDQLIENEYHLSVINKIELLGFHDLTPHEGIKFRLIVNNSVLHSLDDEVIEKTIELRKQYRIKLPDAIIAATCLVKKLSIITMNVVDFEKIKGLNIISPETFSAFT